MKSKILVVEDNYDVRENLSEILNLSGYEAISAPNGKQGVAKAIAEMPDLILCDIMMPELDGYGVLRILSKNPQTENIPFIFLTAKTELVDIRKGMTLGADDYITKPFDDVELLDTIAVRLNKRKAAPATLTTDHRMISQMSAEQLAESLPASWLEGETRFVRKRDPLYTEGQICRNVFLVRSGRAAATKMDDFSKEAVTRLYRAPMIIGITSAITGKHRETVKAIEDLEVIPIRKEDFLQFMLQDRQTTYYFLHTLATDQIETDEKLLLQAFGTVRMKLASTLLELYPLYESKGKAVIPISREELANIAGTAKETIIRCLSEFKEEGLISIRDSDIIIESPRKLNELRY
ncbi:MAG TPA: response regulator [Saprospiraceae bacterium]|nr:response regulator [Saprospiraceae bacterium]